MTAGGSIPKFFKSPTAACDGKEAMPPSVAKKAADRMRKRGIPATAYPCPFCHAWHVGTRPKVKHQ
jgi:hypothetical protein